MTGEIWKFGLRRLGAVQLIRVSKWSEGYNPPRISRGIGYFHVRLGDFELRSWRALR